MIEYVYVLFVCVVVVMWFVWYVRKRNRNIRLERLVKCNGTQSIILFGRAARFVRRCHCHVRLQLVNDTQIAELAEPLRCVAVVLLDQISYSEHCALL